MDLLVIINIKPLCEAPVENLKRHGGQSKWSGFIKKETKVTSRGRRWLRLASSFCNSFILGVGGRV